MVDENKALGLSVLVAEYNSIRAAIDRKANAQLTIIGLNVTGIATVIGFVISKNLDLRVILVLPIFSSTLGLLMYWHDRTADASRLYVKRVLRPLIVEYVDDQRLLGWQDQYTDAKEKATLVLAISAPLGVLFPAVSLVSLVLVFSKLDAAGYWVTWTLGAFLLAVLVACWSTNLRSPMRRALAVVKR